MKEKLKSNCFRCDGTGKVRSWIFFKKDCESCNGKGYTEREYEKAIGTPGVQGTKLHVVKKEEPMMKEEKKEKEEKCPWCLVMIAISSLAYHKKYLCPDRPQDILTTILHHHEDDHYESHHEDSSPSPSEDSSPSIDSGGGGFDIGGGGGGDFGGGGAVGDI